MGIRKAETDDIEDVRSLVNSLAHFYLQDKSSSLPEWFTNTLTYAAFQSRFEDNDYVNFVYEVENNIVAYIAMKGKDYLYHLFVSEQEQRKGIAKLLWQHCLATCKANTYYLRSSLYAIPVYKRFGFKESAAVAEKDGIYFQAMELSR